jgi:DNA polymerase IV
MSSSQEAAERIPPLEAPRWIAHLDMDAFYASVELLRYPELRGRPLVVGGRGEAPPVQADGTRRFARLKDYAGRGVITTASYEARAFGVHSGMGLMKAAALAPDAMLLPTDFDQYRKYSRLFKAAVAEVAPVIEDRGIDEIYIDLTFVPGVQDGEDGVRSVARDIKARVRAATGLSCSIGITPNKLLSKICSDLEKPDGLTIVTEADIATRIWPLPAKRINGIGPKANEKLEGLGIHTIGELAAADPQMLIDRFGPHYGAWLHEAAHGRDDHPVVTYREPKSLSRETTFERDLHPQRDREALGRIFTSLCQRLAADLRAKGYAGRSVGIKLRYDDFRIATRETTLASPTDDADTIRRHAGLCLKRVPLDRKLRLLGVRVGALSKPVDGTWPMAEDEAPAEAALPLFDAPGDRRAC